MNLEQPFARIFQTRLENVREEGEPRRIEVKALTAYSGKTAEGKKIRRVDCIHRGCAAGPDAFWVRGVAGMSAEVHHAAGIDKGMTPMQGWCYPHQLYASL